MNDPKQKPEPGDLESGHDHAKDNRWNAPVPSPTDEAPCGTGTDRDVWMEQSLGIWRRG